MSSRAGPEIRPPGVTISLSAMTDVCPNLSPQQFSDNQIQISGKICLVYSRGNRICAQHKKATARKRVEVATR
jgi:hypothetical protein